MFFTPTPPEGDKERGTAVFVEGGGVFGLGGVGAAGEEDGVGFFRRVVDEYEISYVGYYF